MKRVFIAIDISGDARRSATARIQMLKAEFPRLRVGWERPEKLHLTLKFLGDVAVDSISEVCEAVQDIGALQPPFEVKLARTGVFPNKAAPRILWIGIDPSERAAELAREIENKCADLGFPRERRQFCPHLTIARLRDPLGSKELANAHCSSITGPAPFTVDRIVIYESRLQPSGSVYSKLATFPLLGPRPEK